MPFGLRRIQSYLMPTEKTLIRVWHTCQLSPINSEFPYFGRHSHSPSLFCQKWPNLPILMASPYFLLNFLDFPLKSYTISKRLPHGNCHIFWRSQALLKIQLKMYIFVLSPPWNFQEVDRYGMDTNRLIWILAKNVLLAAVSQYVMSWWHQSHYVMSLWHWDHYVMSWWHI